MKHHNRLDDSLPLTMGIFLDISKAFDCINHQILLSKLYNCGIRGIAHSWFSSYLSNRKQITQYGDQLSEACEIKHGFRKAVFRTNLALDLC